MSTYKYSVCIMNLFSYNSKFNALATEEDVIGSSRGGNRKVAQTPRNMGTLTAVA